MVPDWGTIDPSIFPDPHKVDIARFKKLRECPGQETRHQFVATSMEHMGFGYGSHACPGRFFASNEIKILLCFLVLQYNFRFIEGKPEPDIINFASMRAVDPRTRIEIRRRQEEVDLQNPRPAC